MKYNTLLFPRKANQTNFSLFLLSMRLLFGSLLMTHGYAKLTGFAAMSCFFPRPVRNREPLFPDAGHFR